MKKLWILMLIYFFAGAVAFAADVEVREKRLELEAYADVQPGPVKLGHLIKSFKNIFESPMYELVLAEAPKAGAKIKFSNTAISQAIGHFIANLKDPVEKTKLQTTQIVIPKEIVLQGAGWAASVERLYHYIPRRLLGHCNYSCEIVVDEVTAPKMKANYNDQTSFEIAEFKALPKGQFTVEATVTHNNIVAEKMWIQGRLRILKEVPVAKRMILQSERLKETDFEIKKMDITMESDSTPEAVTLVGSKLRRTITANQIILNSIIEREKDIAYGQPVQVVVRNSDWHISIQAVARDTGSVGDRVKVYNPQSKKVLSGILVSKGVVEIQ